MSFSTDPRTLFQSGAAQQTGERRAIRAQQLSTFTAESGWPISLACVGVPAGHRPSGPYTPLDPTRGAALDGGRFKALSLHSAPRDIVAVAEASGIVRAVHATSGASLSTYPASTGPVAALLPLPGGRALIATSGWDKALRFFAFDPPTDGVFAPPPRPNDLVVGPAPPPQPPAKIALTRPLLMIPDASSDFVKALAWDAATRAVIIAGSDATIRVYDTSPLVNATQKLDAATWRTLAQPCAGPSVPPTLHAQVTATLPTPVQVAALRIHTRPILSLLVAPAVRAGNKRRPHATFFAGDSMGRIAEYTLVRSTEGALTLSLRRELRGHETAVNALSVGVVPVEIPRPAGKNNADLDSEDEEDEIDVRILWSASGDRTVRGWILDTLPPGVKSGPWGGEGAGLDRSSKATPLQGSDPPLYSSYALPLPDVGKAVLPILWSNGLGGADDRIPIITAGADEDLRVWSVPAPGSGQLDNSPSFSWLQRVVPAHWHEITGLLLWTWNDVPYVISSGLDGVVRRWRMEQLLAPVQATEPIAPSNPEPTSTATGMTAEEEAELEALMADE